MKTELLKAVIASKLSENEALDLLQEAGVVSDLCLRLSDVSESDCAAAVRVLLDHMRRAKIKIPSRIILPAPEINKISFKIKEPR